MIMGGSVDSAVIKSFPWDDFPMGHICMYLPKNGMVDFYGINDGKCK